MDYFAARAARLGGGTDAAEGDAGFFVAERSKFSRSGQRGVFKADRNAVQAVVDTTGDAPRVQFGPIGSIRMDEDSYGIGLGSFLLSTVIAALKGKHPDARVVPGTLTRVDGIDHAYPDNLARRRAFYERHGFTVTTDDAGNGRFEADQVADLVERWPEDRIEVLDALEYAHVAAAEHEGVVQATRNAHRLRAENDALLERLRRHVRIMQAMVVAALTAAFVILT